VSERACNGTNKIREPCSANPLKPGTVIEGVSVSGDYCRQHDPNLPESARMGGAQPGAGRPRKPRAVDVLRERIEQDIDRVLNPLWEALEATQGVVVGTGPTATLEVVPDYRTRIAAVRELLDRGYGRAKTTGELRIIDDDAIDALLREWEAEFASNDPDGISDRGFPGEDPGLDRASEAAG
jgi:hypothetical protein